MHVCIFITPKGSTFLWMECIGGLTHASRAAVSNIPKTFTSIKKNGRVRANLNGNDDPLFQAAVAAAVLRFQETRRPEPLFVDPYVGILVPSNAQINEKPYRHCHCLATKFIDDKLLDTVKSVDGPRQVVLLTDGMDTRPYRLSWLKSTVIFEISPESVYKEAARKLSEVGAQIPRSCLFVHVPAESPDLQRDLRRRGFNANRPSVWILQGFPLLTLTSFEDVLFTVSSLAMKGCLLSGELPSWLAEAESVMKSDRKKLMEKVFMGHGFAVDVIDYGDVARSLSMEQPKGEHNYILFSAEHLRLSDDQMENWRREFQRIEDEGDEEGFEEL
ncbi:hypothetical protein Nepgr_022284 [Nepenthes gracilis]|uniref:S-adenosyl-L-methionine-dependent methyltransferase n=1 Tax=Nepenthes gracilis TaxID=150966 RepID=A0AAD3XWU3_NEPGR|nr:hypothetical protein Nepgr_022284 [Nepenthes gracilis]